MSPSSPSSSSSSVSASAPASAAPQHNMTNMRIALVTWNVGGGPSGITPGTDKLLRCANNADVIVVGLQEVGMGRRGWKRSLARSLRSWVYIGGESYAGMRLRVFAKLGADKQPVVHIAKAGMKVGSGLADRLPNKGAIGVEIHFSNCCRVLFVAAHLAANEDQVEERQEDWRSIVRRLDQSRKRRVAANYNAPSQAYQAYNSHRIPLFHRYDHVFVLGDLNYRIEAPGTTKESRVQWVQQHVDRRDWGPLLKADQLTRERLAGKVFANFQEANITFAPTFKINPKTGKYSLARVPSYCDRVLWHSLPARVDLVQSIRYEPLSEFRQSDHVPVIAEFNLTVPRIDAPKPSPVLHIAPGLRVVLEFKSVRFVKQKHCQIRRAAPAAPKPPRISSDPAPSASGPSPRSSAATAGVEAVAADTVNGSTNSSPANSNTNLTICNSNSNPATTSPATAASTSTSTATATAVVAATPVASSLMSQPLTPRSHSAARQQQRQRTQPLRLSHKDSLIPIPPQSPRATSGASASQSPRAVVAPASVAASAVNNGSLSSSPVTAECDLTPGSERRAPLQELGPRGGVISSSSTVTSMSTSISTPSASALTTAATPAKLQYSHSATRASIPAAVRPGGVPEIAEDEMDALALFRAAGGRVDVDDDDRDDSYESISTPLAEGDTTSCAMDDGYSSSTSDSSSSSTASSFDGIEDDDDDDDDSDAEPSPLRLHLPIVDTEVEFTTHLPVEDLPLTPLPPEMAGAALLPPRSAPPQLSSYGKRQMNEELLVDMIARNMQASASSSSDAAATATATATTKASGNRSSLTPIGGAPPTPTRGRSCVTTPKPFSQMPPTPSQSSAGPSLSLTSPHPALQSRSIASRGRGSGTSRKRRENRHDNDNDNDNDNRFDTGTSHPRRRHRQRHSKGNNLTIPQQGARTRSEQRQRSRQRVAHIRNPSWSPGSPSLSCGNTGGTDTFPATATARGYASASASADSPYLSGESAGSGGSRGSAGMATSVASDARAARHVSGCLPYGQLKTDDINMTTRASAAATSHTTNATGVGSDGKENSATGTNVSNDDVPVNVSGVKERDNEQDRHSNHHPSSNSHSHSHSHSQDMHDDQYGEREDVINPPKRGRLNNLRMEVHGAGLFLKHDRVYSTALPKRRNGQRERSGEALPVIPLAPVRALHDLEFAHVLVEFAKKKSRVGTSGALPMRELLEYIGRPYSFEMPLTKYGLPAGKMQACVQLTTSPQGCWMDSSGRVVRDKDGGPVRNYTGDLPIRQKSK